MKKINVLIIAFTLITSLAFSQSKDEQRIRELEKHWTALLDQGDTDALLKIWTEEYVVNNPKGKIVTPTDIVALMKSGHVFPKVERIIEKITFNGNMAIVMGKELQQPADMTPDQKDWIPRRFTNVWVKNKKEWQLAGRQSAQICE
ncbi:nuclear transport factor 2 family protein [Maribacter sp. X9]|uniref:nuclear transport factor 2 family protein n=1 Tax=Maribacter sp. X9 TaxID=3402159 RepID=UPI003AF36AE7